MTHRKRIRKAAVASLANHTDATVFDGIPLRVPNESDLPSILVHVEEDAADGDATMRGRVSVDVSLEFTAQSKRGEDELEDLFEQVEKMVDADNTLGGAVEGMAYLGYEFVEATVEAEQPLFTATVTYGVQVTV